MRTRGSALVPGLSLAAAVVAAVYGLHAVLPLVSPLVAAVVFGAVLSGAGWVPDGARPGLAFAGKRVLRLGVVLLGLQLSLRDVLGIGAPGLALVAAVVTATFLATQGAGRRLGVGPNLSLLTATGFAICGVSAIAAMEGVTEADEDDVAAAVTLVTLCGTLAIFTLPPLGRLAGLEASAFGSWVGASVHDVAQVVAAASTSGQTALHSAVVVKLTRVAMLAPIVAAAGFMRGRRARLRTPDRSDVPGRRPTVVPVFIIGFLAAVAVRSAGAVPAAWLEPLATVERFVLAFAMVGLGSAVDVGKLRRIGARPLALGLASWAVVAGVSYAGVRIGA